MFQRHNISEKACDKAAEIFEVNAEYLSVLNEERLLSLNDNPIIQEEFQEESFDKNNNFQDNYNPPMIVKNPEMGDDGGNEQNSSSFSGGKPIPHNIPLRGKLPAQSLLPSDVNQEDFKFIYTTYKRPKLMEKPSVRMAFIFVKFNNQSSIEKIRKLCFRSKFNYRFYTISR